MAVPSKNKVRLLKKLLVATDLSARSDRALERAVLLAREHSAELTVVHIVDEGLPASLADNQKRAAEANIQKHVNTLRAANEIDISVEVVFGRAYTDILETSERIKAEIIVLGMHREDAFKDMFRGTTVERVIRSGNVPVLLVKDRVIGSYKRTMIGVDFSIHSRRAVEFAVKLVMSGELHLVHAYDVPFKGFLYGQDARQEVSKRHQLEFEKMVDMEMVTFLKGIAAKGLRLHRISQEGTVREVIYRQVSQLKSDLLVIGTHGRTGVSRSILGSVAEDILREPPCDILTVKAW